MSEVRTQRSEHRGQKSAPTPIPPPGGGKARVGMKVRALCSLLFALFLMPSAMAASQNIEDTLKIYLKNNFPWAKIEIRDLICGTEIPEGPPEKIFVEKGPPSRTVFWLEFKNGKKITVTANVKAFDWIVLSRRALRKGYCLQRDDVYVTLMDVTRIPGNAINDTAKVTGRVLTRSIIANMPIVDNMIMMETIMVKRGQPVVILAESPVFNITTKGEIKENSYVGGFVKVINLTSKRLITGLLIDENTVKVEF